MDSAGCIYTLIHIYMHTYMTTCRVCNNITEKGGRKKLKIVNMKNFES